MDGERVGVGGGVGVCVWHEAAPAAYALGGVDGVCVGGDGAVGRLAIFPARQ